MRLPNSSRTGIEVEPGALQQLLPFELSEKDIQPVLFLCVRCGLLEAYVEDHADRMDIKTTHEKQKSGRSGAQIMAAARKRRAAKKRGRKASAASLTPSPPDDIEDRLRRLENLKENGLISDTEYHDRREEILRDV